MTINERKRLALHERLRQALGTEDAATMMDLLPPVDWAEVARRPDVERVDQRVERLEDRVERLEDKVDARFDKMDARFDGLSRDQTTQTRTILLGVVGGMVALASAFGGLLIAAFRMAAALP